MVVEEGFLRRGDRYFERIFNMAGMEIVWGFREMSLFYQIDRGLDTLYFVGGIKVATHWLLVSVKCRRLVL